jgi:hypothetical protein
MRKETGPTNLQNKLEEQQALPLKTSTRAELLL